MTDRPQPLLCAAGMALFLAAMVLAPILAGKFALGPQAAVTGVLLFAGALHLAGRRLGRARERLATPVDLPILVLVAGAFLSLPFSVNPHASVVEILRLLAGVAAFILAAEAAHSWRLQTADCRLQTARSPAAGGAGRPAPDSAGRTSGDGARRSRKVKRASQAAATAKPPRGRVTPSPVHLVTLSPLHLVTTAALPAFWVCVLAGAAWVAGMGVQEYLRALREHWGTWRSFGGFANPNSLAGHLALTMPLMAAAVLALRARTDE